MLDLTKETFRSEISKNMPVLVDFWAPWCGPCRIVGPILEKLSSEYSTKLRFAKLNVDGNQELAARFDVRGVPCMIIFNKGREADRIIGAYPETQLRAKIYMALTKT